MATKRKTPAKKVKKVKVTDLKTGGKAIKGGGYDWSKNVKI